MMVTAVGRASVRAAVKHSPSGPWASRIRDRSTSSRVESGASERGNRQRDDAQETHCV
jgi:hypothetical protein